MRVFDALWRRTSRRAALQSRGRTERGLWHGLGSAKQRHSASKTRVNALVVLHRARDTGPLGWRGHEERALDATQLVRPRLNKVSLLPCADKMLR
jgi:hypothetical protein